MIFKYSKGQFFYEGETGGNSSGAGGGNGDPNNPEGGAFVSPFKDIDKALLDDGARQAVEKAEADLQRLQKEAGEKRAFQSRFDQLAAIHQQTAQQLQTLQQSQPINKGDGKQSLEQILTQRYTDAGTEPGLAAKLAKVNAPIFQLVQDGAVEVAEKNILEKLAPFAGQVASSGAEQAFAEAMAQDTTGLFTDEVKEETWKHVQNALKAGQQVTPQVAYNLASISYMNALRAGTVKPPTAMPIQQQSSRFSFPGASSSVITQNKQQDNGAMPMDADLQAAISATTGGWGVPSLKGKSGSPMKITRGGV